MSDSSNVFSFTSGAATYRCESQDSLPSKENNVSPENRIVYHRPPSLSWMTTQVALMYPIQVALIYPMDLLTSRS